MSDIADEITHARNLERWRCAALEFRAATLAACESAEKVPDMDNLHSRGVLIDVHQALVSVAESGEGVRQILERAVVPVLVAHGLGKV